MRHCYARLTDQDRFHIKTRLDAGDSMRSIAGALSSHHPRTRPPRRGRCWTCCARIGPTSGR